MPLTRGARRRRGAASAPTPPAPHGARLARVTARGRRGRADGVRGVRLRGRARACEADDGAALAAQVCLDASVVGELVRLRPAASRPRSATPPRRRRTVLSARTRGGTRGASAWCAATARIAASLRPRRRAPERRPRGGLLRVGAAAAARGDFLVAEAGAAERAGVGTVGARARRRGVAPHRVQVDAEPVATATLQRPLGGGERRPHGARARRHGRRRRRGGSRRAAQGARREALLRRRRRRGGGGRRRRRRAAAAGGKARATPRRRRRGRPRRGSPLPSASCDRRGLDARDLSGSLAPPRRRRCAPRPVLPRGGSPRRAHGHARLRRPGRAGSRATRREGEAEARRHLETHSPGLATCSRYAWARRASNSRRCAPPRARLASGARGAHLPPRRGSRA